MLYEYYFEGRKPSKAQVIKKINEGIKQNADMIHVSWGENRIDIDKSYNNQFWIGSGWIKGISGYDIAEELNKKNTRDLLNLYNT
jgi:hypothetical protein